MIAAGQHPDYPDESVAGGFCYWHDIDPGYFDIPAGDPLDAAMDAMESRLRPSDPGPLDYS